MCGTKADSIWNHSCAHPFPSHSHCHCRKCRHQSCHIAPQHSVSKCFDYQLHQIPVYSAEWCPIFITTLYTTALQTVSSRPKWKWDILLSLRFMTAKIWYWPPAEPNLLPSPPRTTTNLVSAVPRAGTVQSLHLPSSTHQYLIRNQMVIWFPYQMKLHHEMKSNGLHKTLHQQASSQEISPSSGVYSLYFFQINYQHPSTQNHNVPCIPTLVSRLRSPSDIKELQI